MDRESISSSWIVDFMSAEDGTLVHRIKEVPSMIVPEVGDFIDHQGEYYRIVGRVFKLDSCRVAVMVEKVSITESEEPSRSDSNNLYS